MHENENETPGPRPPSFSCNLCSIHSSEPNEKQLNMWMIYPRSMCQRVKVDPHIHFIDEYNLTPLESFEKDKSQETLGFAGNISCEEILCGGYGRGA